MSREYWDEIEGIGKLYIEKELVVGLEPVLFVCVDDKKNRYLIMTYDSDEGIYVYRRINKDELLDMLENRVTMEQTFRRGERIYKTFISENNDSLGARGYNADEFPGDMLPDKGENYEIDSEYIQRYIRSLRTYKVKREEDELFVCQIAVPVIFETDTDDYYIENYDYPCCNVRNNIKNDEASPQYHFRENVAIAA